MDKKLIQCKMVAPQKVRVRSVLLNPTNESFAYWPRYLCVCVCVFSRPETSN